MKRRRLIILLALLLAGALYAIYLLNVQRRTAAELAEGSLSHQLRVMRAGVLGSLENHQGLVRDDPLRTYGDALFAAYAALVLPKLSSGMRISDHPAALSAAELEPVEQRANIDSRYWELAWLCGRVRGDTDSRKHLHRARAFADYAEQSRLLLLESLELYSARLDAKTLPFGGELELIEAAHAAAPDEAWPLYLRALYHFESGDAAAGLSDLQAGNAAALTEPPAPYPIPEIRAAIADRYLMGNRQVSGAVLQMYSSVDHDRIGIRATKALRQRIEEMPQPDLVELEAWFSFAKRRTLGQQSEVIVSVNTVGFVSRLADWAAADTEDRRAPMFGELVADLKSTLREINYYDPIMEAYVLGARYGPGGIYLAMYEEHADAYRQWQERLAPHMDELAEFRFTQ